MLAEDELPPSEEKMSRLRRILSNRFSRADKARDETQPARTLTGPSPKPSPPPWNRPVPVVDKIYVGSHHLAGDLGFDPLDLSSNARKL